MVGIRDMRKYSLDHFSLWDILFQVPTRCHGSYLRGHRTFLLSLLSLLSPEYFSLSDKKIQELKSLDPPP